MGPRRQPAPVVVVQPDAPPAQLAAEETIFLVQVGHDVSLPAIQPAGQGR
jgi:hypothetical protein